MEFLKNTTEECGINLNEKKLKKLEIYENFLLEFNSHTNLTRITDHQEIAVKHFLDSLLVSNYMDLKNRTKLIDIGTGAGFPGVPLKILNEDIELTLIESKAKKVNFLKELAEKLELKINVFHARAEEVNRKSEFFQKFDVSIARAVSGLENLAKFCLPFVKKGGIFVAMKGAEFEEEINLAKKTLKNYGGELRKVYKYDLPFNYGKRSLIVIDKII